MWRSVLRRALSVSASEGQVLTTAHPHGVYVLTLNSPAKLNALTGRCME